MRVAREDDALVSYAGSQRNVLASLREGTFVASHFDGEGRLGRDRQGRISYFNYYEFGNRLGTVRGGRVGEAPSADDSGCFGSPGLASVMKSLAPRLLGDVFASFFGDEPGDAAVNVISLSWRASHAWKIRRNVEVTCY